MRKLKFLALAFTVLAMGLVSCSSDDDIIIDEQWNKHVEESDLIGVLQLQEEKIFFGSKEIYTNTFDLNSTCAYRLLRIKSDHSLKLFFGELLEEGVCRDYSLDLTWNLNGETFSWGEYYQGDYDYSDKYLVTMKEDYIKMAGYSLVDEDFFEYAKERGIEHELALGEELYFEHLYLKIDENQEEEIPEDFWREILDVDELIGTWHLQQSNVLYKEEEIRSSIFDSNSECNYSFIEILTNKTIKTTSAIEFNTVCYSDSYVTSWEFKENIFSWIYEQNEVYQYSILIKADSMKMLGTLILDKDNIEDVKYDLGDSGQNLIIGDILFTEDVFLKQ